LLARARQRPVIGMTMPILTAFCAFVPPAAAVMLTHCDGSGDTSAQHGRSPSVVGFLRAAILKWALV
jgi:hypothetical protein